MINSCVFSGEVVSLLMKSFTASFHLGLVLGLYVSHFISCELQVYLADYGLAYRYAPENVLKEYKEDPKRCHDGTIEFTSIDAHKGACRYKHKSKNTSNLNTSCQYLH